MQLKFIIVGIIAVFLWIGGLWVYFDKTTEKEIVDKPTVTYDVTETDETPSEIVLYKPKTSTTIIGGDINGHSYWYFTYNFTSDGKNKTGSAIIELDVPYYDDFKLCKSVNSKADGSKNAVIIDFVMEVTENSYKAYNDAY